MPVRIVCPSCSAALSVKDEFAGRAIKCPKCGNVIPASAQQPAAPPPPPAAPKKPAFEVVEDEPPKSGTGTRAAGTGTGTGTGSKAAKPVAEAGSKTAKPVAGGGSKVARPVPAKSEDADGDEDRPRKKRSEERDEDDGGDEGERPAKRKKGEERDREDEERDGERPAKRKKGEDEEGDEGDRPAKRRRRGDDEDDRKGGKKKKGGAGLVVGIIGGVLLLCCGTGVVGVYWGINKAAEKGRELAASKNPRVTEANFNALQVGAATRAQAEEQLGEGKLAEAGDLEMIFPGNPEFRGATVIEKWTPFVEQKRAVFWRNGDEFIIAAFHPDAGAEARLQLKMWSPTTGNIISNGVLDDAEFVRTYPAKKGGPAVEVKAEDLAKAFKDDRAAADAKYKDKTVQVEGKLDDVHFLGLSTNALLVGLPAPPGKILGVSVRCVVAKDSVPRLLNASRGQTLKIKGTCTGFSGDFVDLLDATVESTGPDPSVRFSAAQLISAHAKDPKGTDEKYKEKAMTLTDCIVTGKEGEASVVVVGRSKKAPAAKIKVTVPFEIRDQLARLKPGDTVKMFKGEFGGSYGETLYLNRAWIVP